VVRAVLDALATLPGPLLLAAVCAAALLETAVLAGLVLPGELVVLLGASIAAGGAASPPLVAVAAATGAVAGDGVGFALGRRVGPRLRTCRLGRLVGERRWRSAEDFLARSGGRAVVAARFVGIVRPLAPPLAGMSGLPYRRFAAASALGAVLWSALLVAIGTLFGESAEAVGDAIGIVGWGVVALGLPVAVWAGVRRRRRAVAMAPAPA
jgi:membrane protein DedA with SNARE-associated domain